MDTQETIRQLEQFRRQVYHSLDLRADATMDLIDALSSNTTARSVVELSLNPLFRREYSCVFDAIDNFVQASSLEQVAERRRKEQELLRIIAPTLPQPQARKFWLFGTDATSIPQPFASTLPDRGFVYQPNPIGRNKPVTIGHQLAMLAFLPEKTAAADPAWIVPLLVRRIATQETATEVGVALVASLMSDETLPFHQDLSVQVQDSRYSIPKFLSPVARYDNLVTIARLRSNCVLFRPPRSPYQKRPQLQVTRRGTASALPCQSRLPGVHPTRWPRPPIPVGEVAPTPCTSKPGTRC